LPVALAAQVPPRKVVQLVTRPTGDVSTIPPSPPRNSQDVARAPNGLKAESNRGLA
jgi:hypothetical protein